MIAVALAVVAGVGFTLASLGAVAGRGLPASARSVAVGAAAGILLAIVFADLFPEALEVGGMRAPAIAFGFGFSALFLVEATTRGHTHHHGGSQVVAPHRLAPFVLGLAVHNFGDGAVLGATSALSAEAAPAVAIGILVHQLPVALSVTAVLAAADAARGTSVRVAIVLGLMIPVGALVVVALPLADDTVAGAVTGLAAGALTYVAGAHLLPEVQAEDADRTIVLAFPAALLITTLALVLP